MAALRRSPPGARLSLLVTQRGIMAPRDRPSSHRGLPQTQLQVASIGSPGVLVSNGCFCVAVVGRRERGDRVLPALGRHLLAGR